MRGIVKQRKMKANLGLAWCEKGFHFTAIEAGELITYGEGFNTWPEPCPRCVKTYEPYLLSTTTQQE